jgi:hypothetical protein
VVVTVEEIFFDQHVHGSTLACCFFACYLLINSKFEFLAKIAQVGLELATIKAFKFEQKRRQSNQLRRCT